jgi:hypothetical protein
MKTQLERMVGEEMKMWFGTDGKTYVAATAKDWKSAKAMIEEYTQGKQPLAKDDAFRLVRRNLPADATGMFLFDTGRCVYEIVEFARDMLQGIGGLIPGGAPGAMAIPVLPKPTGGAAYTGIALSLRPEVAKVDIFVPTTAVQQLRKLFSPLLEKDD